MRHHKASDSHSSNKRILRKQLSVDHVTSSLKHASSSSAPTDLNSLLWQVNESSLRIAESNAIKKRASGNNTITNQDLINNCLKTMKSATSEQTAVKAKDKININIFLSHDVQDDGYSDNEAAPQTTHKPPTSSSSSSTNVALKNSNTANIETSSSSANGRLSASSRRAQFSASRRIMSAPIRPINIVNTDDSKNKRKVRKKKVIRDKDIDESPDEYAEELEDMKNALLVPKGTTKKPPPQQMRSRTILGCDQIGIETLVSMINSGESDSEKEGEKDKDKEKELPTPQTIIKNDAPRIRSMLRKTVSFQEDDSQLAGALIGKDGYNIRRNSVVPFAGRMRNTRNLFGQEICNLYMNTNNNNNSSTSSNNSTEEQQQAPKNENDLYTSNQPQEETTIIKEKPKTKTKLFNGTSEEKRSQDLLTQPREEECWRLYEKMKKTGLNISYDTILRGILKPSELRLLEKQKKLLGDIEEKNLEYRELEKAETQ
ncbi:uncharacterized protein [Chironomus tepperi]|uniref:uncharacterized protein n=1 Tax=Chironomus tepperi TaxID=113505 RepID=UPI00391F4520